MQKIAGNTIQPQQYIFNDLYGSQYLKQKFQKKRNYTYFNYLLKMHNKYFQEETTYKDIFGQMNASNANQISKLKAEKQDISNRNWINKSIKKSVIPVLSLQKYQKSNKVITKDDNKQPIIMDLKILNRHTFKLLRSKRQIKSSNPSISTKMNTTSTINNQQYSHRNIFKDQKIIQKAMKTFNKDTLKRTIGEDNKIIKQIMWNKRLKQQQSTLNQKQLNIGNSKIVIKHKKNNSFA